MSTVSVRLPEKLLQEADSMAKALHVPRGEYIRKALETLNREMRKQEKKAKLRKASQRVRKESMKVNAVFSAIENDPKA